MRVKIVVGFAVSIGYIGFLFKNIFKRNFEIIKTTNPIKTYKRIIACPSDFDI